MFEDAESFWSVLCLFLLRRNFLRNTMECDREVVRKATNFVGFIRSRFSIRCTAKRWRGKDVADLCE